jgi:mitogen-activated protein kinase 8 interacting protein 2
LVEAEEDDFWFRGFNMRTGERGVFPAFYAHAVPGPAKDLLGKTPSLGGLVTPDFSLHHPLT